MRRLVRWHKHRLVCAGWPRCSQCVGGLKEECREATLDVLAGLKGAGRVLEGFEGAGSLLEQVVSDAACGLLAAATQHVENNDRLGRATTRRTGIGR